MIGPILLLYVTPSMLPHGTHGRDIQHAPYPVSPTITQLTWDSDVVKLPGRTGDNWPITWVDDDLQVTAYGDGNGFDGTPRHLSLGFGEIRGEPPDIQAADFMSNVDTPEGGGPGGIKASGLLMVEGILYMFVRNYKPHGSDDFAHARLGWSLDRGRHWSWADWHFAKTFGCPEFVQFGRDYTRARDGYVYVVSQANDSAYGYSPDIVLARVPRERVTERVCYEFFSGLSASGSSCWSSDLCECQPVFSDPNGVQRIAVTHNVGLGCYILTSSHLPPEYIGRDASGYIGVHSAALSVFCAPEPWGAWETLYYDHDWSSGARTYHHKFPPRWMSVDGKTMWLLFSGLDGGFYSFCLRKASLDMA